jgi:hypothetical protein
LIAEASGAAVAEVEEDADGAAEATMAEEVVAEDTAGTADATNRA